MLIKCAFVGQKTLIFIEMHGTTTTKKKYSSTCFERLYARRQEVGLRFTPYGFLSCNSRCDAGESGGKMCAL
jgi:hypothetical protein